jgi:hypothetical protein
MFNLDMRLSFYRFAPHPPPMKCTISVAIRHHKTPAIGAADDLQITLHGDLSGVEAMCPQKRLDRQGGGQLMGAALSRSRGPNNI